MERTTKGVNDIMSQPQGIKAVGDIMVKTKHLNLRIHKSKIT